MALIVMAWQDVATDCVKPNTNTTPFEVTRHDKLSSNFVSNHVLHIHPNPPNPTPPTPPQLQPTPNPNPTPNQPQSPSNFMVDLSWPDWLLVWLQWIPAIPWPLTRWAVAVHLQTNNRLDLTQMGGQTHKGCLLIGLNFGFIPVSSRCFMVRRAVLLISRQIANRIVLNFCGTTHNGSIQTWLTYCHASRNSHRFAASYVLAVSMHLQTNYGWDLAHVQRQNTFWSAPGLINFLSYSTEFRPFPGLWFIKQFVHITRLLIGLSLNLLCKLHMNLLWLD